jgi:hypothetical protein
MKTGKGWSQSFRPLTGKSAVAAGIAAIPPMTRLFLTFSDSCSSLYPQRIRR